MTHCFHITNNSIAKTQEPELVFIEVGFIEFWQKQSYERESLDKFRLQSY